MCDHAAAVRAPAAALRHSFAVLPMSKQRRPCANYPDLFCYKCGDYTVKRSQSPVTEFVQKAYLANFGISIRIKIKRGFLI